MTVGELEKENAELKGEADKLLKIGIKEMTLAHILKSEMSNSPKQKKLLRKSE